MGPTLADIFAVRELSENKFESIVLGEDLFEYKLPIGYGGHTQAIGIKAATLTVPSNYHVYSIVGNFLGPARNDRTIIARVRVLRDTRTFQTRSVELTQVQDNQVERLCMSMSVDFHVQESPSLAEFSAQPGLQYSTPEQCPTSDEYRDAFVRKGLLSPEERDRHRGSEGFFRGYFEQRDCPENAFSQKLIGLSKILPGEQQDRPIPERRSACWFRSEKPVPVMDQVASLAFFTDSAVPVVAYAHAGIPMRKVGQASSLDFALRIFVNDLCIENWHLRDWVTIAAGQGRSYGESRVWDQKGRLVCSMTQQAILRPLKQEKLKSSI